MRGLNLSRYFKIVFSKKVYLKMLICEALKIERQKLNLTQSQFADKICSPSNYSKIERGLQQITASDLLLLLSKNKIDCIEFIKKIIDSYQFDTTNYEAAQNLLKIKLAKAFYNRDISKIREIDSEIQQGNFKRELKLESALIRHIVQNDLNSISVEMKQQYEKIFFGLRNWYTNVDSIRLFSNSMSIFENDELEYQMRYFLKHFSTIEESDVYTLEVGASVLVNYLYICYSRKTRNEENINNTIELLSTLPEIPELFVYKCLGKYYNYLIQDNRNKAKELRNFMVENGLRSFINSNFKE